MRIIFINFFFFIYFCSFNTYSQTISVVDINFLIDNNSYYNKIISDIELNQQEYLKQFEIKENELQLKFEEIESSRLILSDKEINLQIDEYNNQLTQYTEMIDKFNFHYQNQIINIREAILKEIIKLIEIYAVENSIDLILDSTSYLIASNSLNITNDINNELEKLNLNLEYKNFEEN
ncbi:OmpH family outer membrane protein [Pelagibacteraceae bacterium]|nr:OmpH family outer membrane protein [Pelagibacteraceae bacterium]